MNYLKLSEAFIPLVRSRRFIAAVVSVLVMLLVVAVPQLEPLEDGLVRVIVNVILVLLDAPTVI